MGRSRSRQHDNGDPLDPSIYATSPPKPEVNDSDLRQIINAIYYANPIIGRTLADTARYERLTGSQIKGRNHIKKARQTLRSLAHWLSKLKNHQSDDRDTAIRLYNDLADALEMNDWQGE